MSEKVETDSTIELLPSIASQPVARRDGAGRGLVVGDRARDAGQAASRRLRFFGPLGLLVSFIGMVLIPTAFAGYYFAWIASDVFVSEAKFAVRGSTEKLPSTSVNASVAATASSLTTLNSNQDAYIVSNYVQSIPLIERLEREEGLRSLFTRSTIDSISRLSSGASMEQVRKYWSRMISASVDSLSGVVSLEVRAYAPADALALSRAVITASEELVNELSRRRRADALRFANEEVSRAEDRVKASVVALQAFRNQTGFLDPVKSAEAVSKLLATLRSDQIELANELATARSSLSESAPSIQVLSTRLAALQSQIRDVERELTTKEGSGSERSASRALSTYEGLMLEREFAEKLYTVMLTSAQTARSEADRQQLYLVTFVEPSLAQTALYPRRFGDTMLVLVCAIAVWSILSLLVAAVRDHDG